MTTLARLRKGALALSEVEEGTHFGMVAFFVRGKSVASVSKDGEQVQSFLPRKMPTYVGIFRGKFVGSELR